jgi:hypothetical protein
MKVKFSVEQQNQLIGFVLQQYVSESRHALIQVRYKPNCGYLFAARRFNGGVLVETGLNCFNPRLHKVMRRAAQAANEIIEERTTAVAIRRPTHA